MATWVSASILAEWLTWCKVNEYVILKTGLNCFKICLLLLDWDFIFLITFILMKLLGFWLCTPSTDFNYKFPRRYHKERKCQLLQERSGVFSKIYLFLFSPVRCSCVHLRVANPFHFCIVPCLFQHEHWAGIPSCIHWKDVHLPQNGKHWHFACLTCLLLAPSWMMALLPKSGKSCQEN